MEKGIGLLMGFKNHKSSIARHPKVHSTKVAFAKTLALQTFARARYRESTLRPLRKIFESPESTLIQQ